MISSQQALRFSGECGIAIGPILFIIAVLAVLAAAIAAGSGSFTSNSGKESAKIMASSILQRIDDIETAVKIVEANGYNYTQVSFEIPSSDLTTDASGNDWQFATTNANCTVDGCKVFKLAGGGILPSAWPGAAFSLSAMPNGWGLNTCPTLITEYCRSFMNAIFPMQVTGLGASTDYRFGLWMPAIDINVCMQINILVGVPNPNNAPPVQGTDIAENWIGIGPSSGFDQNNPNNSSVITEDGAIINGKRDFCFFNNSGFYVYVHEFYD